MAKRLDVKNSFKQLYKLSEDTHNIFTPFELCDEMLDKIPNLNKDMKILVMFNLEFVYVLLERFGRENMNNIWFMTPCKIKGQMSKSLGLNENNINIYSYKDNKIEGEENMPKFDVVVGNPPYQNASNSKSESLWPKITKLALKLLKKDGYLIFLTSDTWISRRLNDKKGLRYFFQDKYVMYIKWGKFINKYFNVGTTISMFLIKNSNEVKNTIFSLDDNILEYSHNKLDYIPYNLSIDTINILNKLNTHNFIPGNFKELPGYRKGSKIISDIETNIFKYKIANTSSQYNKNIYLYSSVMPKYFNDIKLVFSDSGYARPFYDNGNIGMGHHARCFFINNQNESKNLIKYLSSNIIIFLKNSKTKSGTAVDISIIAEHIPIIDLSHEWTNENLYNHFNLSQEEIAYIESFVS